MKAKINLPVPKFLMKAGNYNEGHESTRKQHLSSYDVAVIQLITSCHKNRMTTLVITLWRVHVKSLTTSVLAMRFLVEIMLTMKAIKSHLKGSFDKHYLTLVGISYEIYETRRRLVS